jgi:hypothetical protein
MTDEQDEYARRIRQNRRLRAAHQERLDALEVQRVTLGSRADATIDVEITREQDAIEQLDAELVTLRTPDDVREHVSPDARYRVLTQTLKGQDERIGAAFSWTQDQIKQLDLKMTRSIAQMHADIMADIGKVIRENAAQSGKIETLQSQQRITNTTLRDHGQKIDKLAGAQVLSERHNAQARKVGQRRYLIISLFTLLLLLLFISGVIWLLSSVGLITQ